MRRTAIVLIIVCAFWMSSRTFGAEVKPPEITKNDKCRVCGMFVAPYPKWAAQIVFHDGSAAAFDGPKDMFKYYLNIQKFDKARKQSDVAAAFVTEYYSAAKIDAKKVVFVKGSDVQGPMGNELVPIESADKAKVFMNDHKGKAALKFGEVTMEDLK